MGEKNSSGTMFAMEVPAAVTIEQLRESVKIVSGADMHIVAKVGPATPSKVPGLFLCSIAPVDDPAGDQHASPQVLAMTGRVSPDKYICVYYFKQPENAKAA